MDALLIREALDASDIDADLRVYRDGSDMLAAIEKIDRGEEPCPDVFLLDLNLPKHTGAALLARIRDGRVCENVPVIIVTSSNAEQDRQTAAQLGATDYFCKSADLMEFMRLGEVVRSAVGGRRPN